MSKPCRHRQTYSKNEYVFYDSFHAFVQSGLMDSTQIGMSTGPKYPIEAVAHTVERRFLSLERSGVLDGARPSDMEAIRVERS